jgi:hypothetical protein
VIAKDINFVRSYRCKEKDKINTDEFKTVTSVYQELEIIIENQISQN